MKKFGRRKRDGADTLSTALDIADLSLFSDEGAKAMASWGLGRWLGAGAGTVQFLNTNLFPFHHIVFALNRKKGIMTSSLKWEGCR